MPFFGTGRNPAKLGKVKQMYQGFSSRKKKTVASILHMFKCKRWGDSILEYVLLEYWTEGKKGAEKSPITWEM